jgi:hypothetical protein
MKKQMIAMLLATLAVTSVFANGDASTQTNNTGPSMEAQPQTSNNPDQATTNVSGTAMPDQQTGSQN